MTHSKKIFLSSLLPDELQKLCIQWGFEAYRARQILDGIYRHRMVELKHIKNLPLPLQKKLLEQSVIHNLKIVQKSISKNDSSVKYLFELHDRELVEAVWMPQEKHKTICLSTQVGCPLQCTFCASGQVRYKRDLLVHEMIGQILLIQSELAKNERIGHIVFMGMGEPLLNLENLQKTITILNAPWAFEIGARRITVSSAGFVPGILKWAKLPDEFQQVRLSISLHATRDSVRDKLVPINRKYPLASLLEALNTYCEKTGRKITLEYVLLSGINDSSRDARELSEIAKGIAHSINLIEYNPVPGIKFKRSTRSEFFMQEIKSRRVPVTLRQSKGTDIEAACGQLRGKFLAENKNFQE